MEVEIRVEFDLNIEEGADAVSDETVGQIQQDAFAIIDQGGAEIVEDAQEDAPVRTGALVSSIYYSVEDVSGLTIGASVSYASFQEEGTSRIKAKHFLKNAIDEHQPMIQEELDEMIAEHLSRDSSEDNPELEFDVEMESRGE